MRSLITNGDGTGLELNSKATRFSSAIERLLYLRGLTNLHRMSGRELRIAAQQSQERFFEAGSVILTEGRVPESMHFIVEGSVDVSREGLVHMTCTAPGGVGFIPLVSQNPVGVTAVATSDTLTLAVPANKILELLEDNFEFLVSAMQGTSAQLGKTLREVELAGILKRDPAEAGEYPSSPLDMVQRLRLMRSGPYSSVNLEPLLEMARRVEEVRIEPGQVLWREGDPSTYGLNIIHGIVRCTGAEGSRVFRLGKESVLGYMEAYSGDPRPYEAVAETRIVALKGVAEDLLDIVEDHQEVGVAFVAFIANIITDMRIKVATAKRSAEDGSHSPLGP